MRKRMQKVVEVSWAPCIQIGAATLISGCESRLKEAMKAIRDVQNLGPRSVALAFWILLFRLPRWLQSQ